MTTDDQTSKDLTTWLTDATDTLHALRTGTTPDHGWEPGIEALDHHLLPRLHGILDAAIRAHAETGASHGDLAKAMHVSRSTAQSRRKAILDGRGRPSEWEQWATGSDQDAPEQ
ncbi:hypothetical protein [Streptomyces laurentii]|uniref:hypothetical protein n=1 Tax=Streptomyces laurentii TaxID=39478 RepID=UPI0033C6DF94